MDALYIYNGKCGILGNSINFMLTIVDLNVLQAVRAKSSAGLCTRVEDVRFHGF